MQQQGRFARLGQRGLEGGNQLVRQLADEADGVRDHHRGVTRQHDAPNGGIQGCEQLVGDIRVGAGQGAEQGGFAGVGVTHQRQRRNRDLGALLAARLALQFDLLQARRQRLDSLAQQTPVGLKLGFAGTTVADTATPLTLEVGPAAHQARGDVLELRQLHFELAFMTARALREDVEDETGAIQHPALDELFEVALLRRRQRMIEQHQVGVVFGRHGRISSALPLPTKKRGSGRSRRPPTFATGMAPAERASCSNSSMSSGIRGCAYPQAHEHGTFTCAGSLEHDGISRGLRERVQPRRSSFAGDRLDRRAVFVGDAHVARRNNGRNRVFVDHLAHAVLQQDDELIKRIDLAL